MGNNNPISPAGMSIAPETHATMGEFISVYKEIVGACSLVYQKLVTLKLIT